MPGLPDIVIELEALERRIVGETLGGFRVWWPSVPCTFDPPHEAVPGRRPLEEREKGRP